MAKSAKIQGLDESIGSISLLKLKFNSLPREPINDAFSLKIILSQCFTFHIEMHALPHWLCTEKLHSSEFAKNSNLLVF